MYNIVSNVSAWTLIFFKNNSEGIFLRKKNLMPYNVADQKKN